MIQRLPVTLVALVMFALVAGAPVSATYNGAYYVVAPDISQGATVFIGEQGLNVTTALAQAGATTTRIAWWASAADVYNTPYSQVYDFGPTGATSFMAGDDFVGYTGNWYAIDDTDKAIAPFFNVQDPTLSVNIWDFSQSADVTGRSVVQGDLLGFKISTNMISAISDPNLRSPIYGVNGSTIVGEPGDGYINVRVRDESGATFTSVLDANGGTLSLSSLNITRTPYIVGLGLSNWSTGAYPIGTYTVYAESLLNNMKANYKNGGVDYTTKTVSQTVTISLVANIVNIQANKDSVVRSKPFSVTVTGKPATIYHLWVQGTSDLSGGPDGQPPLIATGQMGVTYVAVCATAADQRAAAAATLYSALGYAYQNAGAGRLVFDDVSHVLETGFGSRVAANIVTSASGTRTVEFVTSVSTKPQDYIIRVEQNFGSIESPSFKRDEVPVRVERGAVTVVADGDQTYYPGEEIKFSGTNTESYTTYLFITGPDLNANGAQLVNPQVSVVNQEPSTFAQADVAGDNTWSYYWGTTAVPLNSGTYTIYAVSQPVDRAADHIASAAYGTVSIIINLNGTVPHRSTIGVVRNSNTWLLDESGNGAYGAGDVSYSFGKVGDTFVTGDWNTDGKTEIGVVRNSNIWLLDDSGNGAYGAGDLVYSFGKAGDTFVTGDWNTDGKTEIGVVRNGNTWLLDASGNGAFGAWDFAYSFGKAGDMYVTGDWNNDGKTEIGVVRNGNTWLLDASGDGAYGAGDLAYSFGKAGDLYVTGDWNADGKTEIGVVRNGNTWLLDASGDGAYGAGDYAYTFGKAGDVNVTGQWNSTDVKPSINNIIPDEGTAGNVISITDLTGSNFQSGATVTLIKSDYPNITATNVNVVSSNLITCTLSLPLNTTAGSWDLVVTNPGGQYAVYTNLFIIYGSPNPTPTTTSSGEIGITSIDPRFVAASNTYLPITVFGSNFQNGITARLTRSGNSDIVATTIGRIDTTQMRCFFNIPTLSQGTWSLVLTNTDGSTGILEDAFDVLS